MTAQPQYTTPVPFALEHLNIDPMSPSGFSWKTSGTGRRADLRAGRRDTHGYWQVWLGSKLVSCHRLILEMVNGPIPAGLLVNHIDLNPANNLIGNLELLSGALNSRHTGKRGRKTFLPVGMSVSAVGRVIGCYSPGDGLSQVYPCKSFSLLKDHSSERLNAMTAALLKAFIKRDGEGSPTVASFYCALPDEAVFGPAEGWV